MSYAFLHPRFRNFALSLSSESIPRNHQEALSLPHWKAAMDEEIAALTTRGTWELVTCTVRVIIITCKWVYTIKYKVDDSIDRYKVRLVTRGFTQTYGIDYIETFSPVARLNSIRVILSFTINNS